MTSLLASLVLFSAPPQSPPPIDTFLQKVSGTVAAGVQGRIEELFARKTDAEYLLTMGQRRGGIRNLKVTMIPVPPGWEKEGPYWAVFSARQDIEDDHDTVYSVVRTMDGWEIGREVPESFAQGVTVAHTRTDAILFPAENRIDVDSALFLKQDSERRAPVFRLNLNYSVSGAVIDGKTVSLVQADASKVPSPKEGDAVRAGGLLIYWSAGAAKEARFKYSGIVKSNSEDKIDSKACYVTAYWVPTIGRLPHTSSVRVRGPKDWVIVSEGLPAKESIEGFEPAEKTPDNYQTVIYRCDIPISYPKIIGGQYKLAAEKTESGKTFRSYQFEPIDTARAQKDVEIMASAAKFFEENLGPFPFPSYACFDADTYYGIESYSYTLLNYKYTTTFVAHEMGHTYFGGLASCSYTKDTWNESLTQYVDSVLFSNNSDRTLQAGLATLRLQVPLSKMSIAHEYGSASYYRGAYMMRMLEHEIGHPAMVAGLKSIVATRQGKDTTWADLRPLFEQAGGKGLDWFWKQWIDNSVFPKLELTNAAIFDRGQQVRTDITVKQRGTENPFHMKFKIVVRGGGQSYSEIVTMSGPEETFRISTSFAPIAASIDVFEYTFAETGQEIAVKR